jgi:hypothetical protein
MTTRAPPRCTSAVSLYLVNTSDLDPHAAVFSRSSSEKVSRLLSSFPPSPQAQSGAPLSISDSLGAEAAL